MKYRVVPCTVKEALRRVREWHRHLPRLQGGLFAAQLVDADGRPVGVAVAGNPARVWQGTGRLYVTRLAVIENLPRVVDSDGKEHASPTCTKLYAAICAAARALGYREVWTYTLPHEKGVSLKAAGFVDMGLTTGGEHDRPSRRRKPAVHPEPKRRWVRVLRRKGEASDDK